MINYYVYLIKNQSRLVILKQENNDSNYIELLKLAGGSEEKKLFLCKMFCLGFLYGGYNRNYRIVNDEKEFL